MTSQSLTDQAASRAWPRLRPALPALAWLRSHDKSWLRGDVVAAITLAAYLLPAALGDASLASQPPQAGLYACLFGGIDRFTSVADAVEDFQTTNQTKAHL